MIDVSFTPKHSQRFQTFKSLTSVCNNLKIQVKGVNFPYEKLLLLKLFQKTSCAPINSAQHSMSQKIKDFICLTWKHKITIFLWVRVDSYRFCVSINLMKNWSKLMKCENLLNWRKISPNVPKCITFCSQIHFDQFLVSFGGSKPERILAPFQATTKIFQWKKDVPYWVYSDQKIVFSGIVIYSPPLDGNGNSARGIKFCQLLIQKFNFHIFDNLLGVITPNSFKIDPCKCKKKFKDSSISRILLAIRFVIVVWTLDIIK